MMERIMGLKKYQYNDLSGFDSKYIVQLRDSFRCHPAILQYSNESFYNSRLISRQKVEIANFALGWKYLPNKECPIIFQANFTESKSNGTSLNNSGEINLVKGYVETLLRDGINGKAVSESDIGVITPYVAQQYELDKIFTNGIEIGTTEYFQGREKLIIIVSSVRSRTQTIGFLKNERRLNVALTRAKALMIVIGNPNTLSKDKFWRGFIEMCRNYNAYVHNIPSFKSKVNAVQVPNEVKKAPVEVKRIDQDAENTKRFDEIFKHMAEMEKRNKLEKEREMIAEQRKQEDAADMERRARLLELIAERRKQYEAAYGVHHQSTSNAANVWNQVPIEIGVEMKSVDIQRAEEKVAARVPKDGEKKKESKIRGFFSSIRKLFSKSN
jgi:hypothetical protein